MTKVLTQPQAEAVYRAMHAMNNVGATIKASIPPAEEGGRWVHVEECADSGQITLTTGLRRVACYSNQSAFAAAYGLAMNQIDKKPAVWDLVGMLLVLDKRLLIVLPLIIFAPYFLDKFF